jgi:hypothetical protein
MKSRFVFLLAVVVTLLAAAPASAGAPTREFLPAGPFDITGACPFVVHVDYLANKEYAITFTDADGNPTHAIVQGDLVAKFTNVSNEHSVTINISGPGRYDFGSDGSLLVTAWGNWTFPFVPGQLGPGAPGELILNQGTLVLFIAPNGFDETIVSHTGKQTDVCAMIA